MTGAVGRVAAVRRSTPKRIYREVAMKTPVAHRRIRQTVRRMTSRAGLAIIAGLVFELAGTSMAAEPRATLPSAPATERNLSRRIGFEANCGQVDAQVQFVARGPAYTAFLTSTEAVLALGDRRGGHAVLRMERIGANAGARAAGSGLLPGAVSYFPD